MDDTDRTILQRFAAALRLDELREHGLLRVNQRSVRNHRARGGVTRRNEYALLGDFITPQPIPSKDQP